MFRQTHVVATLLLFCLKWKKLMIFYVKLKVICSSVKCCLTRVLGVKFAAQRKLENELGIKVGNIPLSNFHCLTRIHYRSIEDCETWGEHESISALHNLISLYIIFS